MEKMTTEMQLISIEKLVPYANNARTHSAEQIKKTMVFEFDRIKKYF